MNNTVISRNKVTRGSGTESKSYRIYIKYKGRTREQMTPFIATENFQIKEDGVVWDLLRYRITNESGHTYSLYRGTREF